MWEVQTIHRIVDKWRKRTILYVHIPICNNLYRNTIYLCIYIYLFSILLNTIFNINKLIFHVWYQINKYRLPSYIPTLRDSVCYCIAMTCILLIIYKLVLLNVRWIIQFYNSCNKSVIMYTSTNWYPLTPPLRKKPKRI